MSEENMSDENLAPTSLAVLRYLVEAVVTHPAAVNIEVSPANDSDTIYMDVSVGEGDMGRVIGRRGRMANTIRTIVGAASISDDCVVDVDFLDN